MLDLGGCRKILADEAAPFGEILGAAEIDGVVLERLPLHHQTIALRLLDRLVQLETVKTLGAAESCLGLGDGGLKVLLAARLDVDLRDLGNHVFPPIFVRWACLPQPATKKKTPKRRPARSRNADHSGEQQSCARHDQRTTGEQRKRPVIAALRVMPL